jgi:predicted DNA-binding transcriptional regulator YafY
MPSDKTRNTLARQWELLKLLPTRGTGKTAKEITDLLKDAGFDVSKRQVERDLNELAETFALHCNDAGTPYGWRWMDDASADLPGLTLADALSLHLVEDSIRPLLPAQVLRALEPRFKQAANKLDQLAEKSPTARWANKVRSVAPMLPLLPPKIDERVLETVQEALFSDEQLDVLYRSVGKDGAVPMRLHPLGLVQRGPVTYLVATAFSYDNVRLYALHRILEASRTHEEAAAPKEFNLDDYIASGALQFGGGQRICLEALVAPDLAEILSETPLSRDQRLTEEGDRFRLIASVTDSWQLRWWVLGQGEAIKIIGPQELRENIKTTISKIAAQYQA